MIDLRHVVPLLLLGACYVSHPGGGPFEDAAVPDLGRVDQEVDGWLLDASPPDVSVEIDMGASECPAVRAESICGDLLFPVAESFSLPFEIDACSCCPSMSCSVEVDNRTHTIQAQTGLCQDLCDCVACNPAVGQCDVPPLAEGLWNVTVNGEAGVRVTISDSLPEYVGETCRTLPVSDGECGGDLLTRSPYFAEVVCASHRRDGRFQISVNTSCVPCGMREGEFIAVSVPRDRDESRQISVFPSSYPTGCDIDCGPCEAGEFHVILPRDVEATPGLLHRLVWDGEEVFEFGAELQPCARVGFID